MKFEKLFLVAYGRMGRKDYWIGLAVLLAGQIAAKYIPYAGTLVALVLVYPAVCVYAKRLHDLGLSGWWMAVPWIGSVIGVITAAAIAGPSMMAVSGGPQDEVAMLNALWTAPGVVPLLTIVTLVNIAFVIWLGVAPGQTIDNRFGRYRPIDTAEEAA